MDGPYKPGDVIAAQVTAGENISSIAKGKFIKISSGTITDITSAVTLTVTGTGTQSCEVKWTPSSGYAAGDVVSGTVVVTLATSGAQPPVPLHDPVKLVQWGPSSIPAAPSGQINGGPVLVENDGGVVGVRMVMIANTPVTSSAVVGIDFGDTVATRANQDTAQTSLNTLTTRLSAARAGYLDNLNVGGAVASHADVLAINQSAAKHLLLQTVGQYERPESGTTTYTVECRTFSAATGAATDADATPTLTATGQATGSLAANLAAATHPATGVYRWAYTVASDAALEPVRFDVSATIATTAFTLSCYTQVCDFVAATFTTGDRTNLQAIADALPDGGIADEANAGTRQTALLTAVGTPMQSGAKVDLVDAPNATAVAAIQSGLSTVTTAQVRAQADAALAGVGLTTTVTGRIDVAVSSVSGGGNSGSGDGDTPVNHNTGGTDAYRIKDGTNGIDGATLKAYLTSEYDADPTTATLRGTTYTGSDGRWVAPLMLNAGLAYTIVVRADGYDAYSFEVTP